MVDDEPVVVVVVSWSSGVFPINLFAVKQLDYFQPDATEGIAAILKDAIGTNH